MTAMSTDYARVQHTHHAIDRIEAWAYVGQPFAEWPDWLRAHYMNMPDLAKAARKGYWALRDDEGYFWRWQHPEVFARNWTPIAAVSALDRGPNPRVTDNDQGEITVTLDGKELRGWSYANDDERRRKMLQAREYIEGWCDGRKPKGGEQ